MVYKRAMASSMGKNLIKGWVISNKDFSRRFKNSSNNYRTNSNNLSRNITSSKVLQSMEERVGVKIRLIILLLWGIIIIKIIVLSTKISRIILWSEAIVFLNLKKNRMALGSSSSYSNNNSNRNKNNNNKMFNSPSNNNNKYRTLSNNNNNNRLEKGIWSIISLGE